MDVIATRREAVRLDLEDHFTRGMVDAAAATKLLDRELNSLSGSAVRSNRSLADSDKQITRTGKSAEQTGKQIDRLSGRLALFAQAAAVLGPAVAPIGAAAVPAIAGMTAEFASAAAAVGVAVLAFKGMGDGLKALNAYQLEPTTKNLQKMRLEMQKLGPDGAHFVRFLDSLGPQLRDLQMTARAGLLPGVESGINHLLTLLPRVKRIVGDLAGAMGELSADAGANLAGPKFREFFQYLEREARPLLIDLGHTVGNFADGFAAMAVAFGPLSSDFADGLEHMSAAFADWAHGLQSSDSFQSFLDYVQANGPRVLDLFGSLADLLVQIVQAAAPLGSVTVPALTALVKVVTTLVDSPLGPTFLAAASALSIYSRGAALAEKASVRLGIANSTGLARFNAMSSAAKQAGIGLGLVALSMTDLDEKAGVSNTAMLTLAGAFLGPWGAAAGAAIGLTMDLAASNDALEAAISRANDAIKSGDFSQQKSALKSLQGEVDNTNGPVRNLGDVWNKAMSWISDSSTRTELHAASALTELQINLKNTGDIANLLSGPLGFTNGQLDALGYNAERASKWLAHLNGALDQRAAWSAYEAAIDGVNASLKTNGETLDKNTPKGRANRAVLDEIARSAGAVADNLKGADRADYLAHARSAFVDAATKLGMTEKGAKRLADRLGLLDATKAKPKIDADDKPFNSKLSDANKKLDRWGITKKSAKADVLADNAFAKLYALDKFKIHDKTMTVHVGVTGGGSVGIGASLAPNPVYGAGVPRYVGGYTGPGGKYEPAGVVHRGEVVIPAEETARDWDMLKARYGYLPGFDGGGLVGSQSPVMAWDDAHGLSQALNDLARRFGALSDMGKHELEQRKKMLEHLIDLDKHEVDRDKRRHDAMVQELADIKNQRAQLMQSVKSQFSTDIFGGNIDLFEAAKSGKLPTEFVTAAMTWAQSQGVGGSIEEQVQAYIASLSPTQIAAYQAQAGLGQLNQDASNADAFQKALKEAKKHGLSGGLLRELEQSGNLQAAQQFASMSAEQIAAYEKAYRHRQYEVTQTAQMVGNDQYGAAINAQTRAVERSADILAGAQAELKLANQAYHRLEHRLNAVEKATKHVGQDTAHALNGSVRHGQRKAS